MNKLTAAELDTRIADKALAIPQSTEPMHYPPNVWSPSRRMAAMECCHGECHQGRECPLRPTAKPWLDWLLLGALMTCMAGIGVTLAWRG